MIVKKIHIRAMEPLQEQKLSLGKGINLCQGEKGLSSALCVFLERMLYGTEGSKKDFIGFLWFTRGGKNYRLTRGYMEESDMMELINETEGARLGEEDLSPLYGESSSAVFENQVRLLPLRSATTPDLNRELHQYVSSVLAGGDRNLRLEKTFQFLKMHRKDYSDRREKAGKRSQQEKEKLKTRIDTLDGETRAIRGKVAEAKAAFENAKPATKKERAEQKRATLLRLRDLHKHRNRMILFSVLGFAMLVGSFFALLLTMEKSNFFLVRTLLGAGITGGITLGISSLLKARSLMAEEQRTLDKWSQEQKRYKRQDDLKRKLKEKYTSLRQEEKEKEADLVNVCHEFDRYSQDVSKPRGEKAEIEAIDVALQSIKDLSEKNRERVQGPWIKRAGEILKEVTGGELNGIVLREEKLMVLIGERQVDPDRLSRGRLEQLYLSLQLSFSELLTKGEPLPLIGEDLFRAYEEDTMTETLSYLAKTGRQILLYVTTEQEKEILEEQQIPFTQMSLQRMRQEKGKEA